MSKENMVEIIVSILKDKLKINKEFLDKSIVSHDEPLTGGKISLSSIEMVYLYFELKRQLNFDKGKINFKNYSLMTINGIANSLWQA